MHASSALSYKYFFWTLTLQNRSFFKKFCHFWLERPTEIRVFKVVKTLLWSHNHWRHTQLDPLLLLNSIHIHNNYYTHERERPLYNNTNNTQSLYTNLLSHYIPYTVCTYTVRVAIENT